MGQSNSYHNKHHHHIFEGGPGSAHYNSSSFYQRGEKPGESGDPETYSSVAPLLLLLLFIILSAVAVAFYFWRKHGYLPMSLMCAHFPEIKRPAVPNAVTNFWERISSALSPFTLPFARFSNDHSNSNSSRPQTFVDGGFASRTRPVAENVDAVWPTKNGLTVPLPTPVSGQNNSSSSPLDISIPALPVINGYSNQVYDVVDVAAGVQAQHQVQGGGGLVFDKKRNGNCTAIIQVDACVNAVYSGTEHKENSCEEPVYAAIEVSNDYETLQDLKAFAGQGT